MVKETDYRNMFIDKAEAYEQVVQSKHIRLIYNLEKDIIEKIFSEIDSKEKTLMDFACGSGRWTSVLEKHFLNVVGVDVSEQMISVARKKCENTEFVVTDITSDKIDEALKGKKFDVITAFRFYKNAQDSLRKEATAELPKYLKDDGLFIFDLHLNTFSIMGILASITRFLKFSELFGISKLQIRTMSLSQIRKIFTNSEFEIVDYYGMGILPGRSNYIMLPQKLLYKVESFFTRHKILRNISYNILVIAKKKAKK